MVSVPRMVGGLASIIPACGGVRAVLTNGLITILSLRAYFAWQQQASLILPMGGTAPRLSFSSYTSLQRDGRACA